MEHLFVGFDEFGTDSSHHAGNIILVYEKLYNRLSYCVPRASTAPSYVAIIILYPHRTTSFESGPLSG